MREAFEMRIDIIATPLVIISIFLASAPADAQQTKTVPRIGFISALSPSSEQNRVEAFRQGLRELGYVEGRNIFMEYRYGEGKRDRLPKLAAELVRLNADLIVAAGGSGFARVTQGNNKTNSHVLYRGG